jgi:hypothetical protein
MLHSYANIRQGVWGKCMAEMEGKLEFPSPSILDKLAPSPNDVQSARSSASCSLADRTVQFKVC